jgi:dienelactone hydrolase
MRNTAIFILLLVAMLGCGGKPSSNAQPNADQPNDPNSGENVPDAWKVGKAASIEKVMLRTSDGIDLSANFRPAAEGSNAKVPAFICIPMLSRTKSDYDSFSELLSEVGIASLALDLRGHGESTMGGKIRFRSFDEKQWNECLKDVNAAIGWMKNRPEIDQRYVGLIGASIGANFALKAGNRDDVSLVIALSPGLDYHGVKIEEDAVKIGPKAIYIICTDGDTAAKETADKLSQIMDPGTEVRIIENEKSHGTEMFRLPFFQEGVIRWITDKIGEMYRADLNDTSDGKIKKSVKIPANAQGN